MSELKEYVDLKTDELKLRAAKGLSLVMSRLVSTLLLIGLLAIVLGLLSLVLIFWIAEWTGSPALAATIVCGVFIALLAAAVCLRKRLFRDGFVKLFIEIFYGDE